MKFSKIRDLITDWDAVEKGTFDTIAFCKTLGLAWDDAYHEMEMDSPYADTHRDVTARSRSTILHSHPFFELLCCQSGCETEYLMGTQRYRLQRGDIIVVPPGISHRPLLPEAMQESYVRDVLWVSAEFMQTIQELLNVDTPELCRTGALLRTAGTQWEYLTDLFHQGVLEAEGCQPGWEAAVIGNTITLLTHLMRAFHDKHTPALRAERPELLDQALHYIEENMTAKITVSDVARHLYVSDSTVSLIFRQKMGISFHQYLTQRRLIAAKTRIRQNASLETVGREVGFADYSTFYRAFKQEYGISPSQFRKEQSQKY